MHKFSKGSLTLISSALPSQWRAELQLNADLATPTAERSGLA